MKLKIIFLNAQIISYTSNFTSSDRGTQFIMRKRVARLDTLDSRRTDR